MAQVKARCSSCRGSGLYQGFAELKDEAVVCLVCRGTGCETNSYTPFKARKRHPNKRIKWVSLSRGGFLATGVGPAGDRISIDDFYAGKLPKHK